MAILHEHDEPVNDGERAVLKLLRDGLPNEWHVVSNFWAQQGTRQFECDAAVISPDGWIYLVETKAWLGRIKGNNKQWELPALTKHGSLSYRPNPVNQTHRNAQILKDVLKKEDASLSQVFVAPLVVIVSDQRPELEGSCAERVVLVDELLDRVQVDPRTDGRPKAQPEVPRRVAEALERTTRNIAPDAVLGPWELEELVDQGDNWELWRAKAGLGGSNTADVRLKRYRLDSLAIGEDADRQREQARRSLEVLERLGTSEGALPLLGPPLEIDSSFVVVTAWPAGESLGYLIESGDLDESSAEDVFQALVRSVASVHHANIVHRNLTPDCAHFVGDGIVVLTDFDYARLPERTTAETAIREGFDPDFAAPEVADDPASATPAADVWSVARIGLRLFGAEAGTLDAIPQRWRPAFEKALLLDSAARTPDAEVLLGQLTAQRPPPAIFDGFQQHDLINNRYVVQPDAVGEGGTARVYRVYDVLHKTYYAAKFVKPDMTSKVDPSHEFLLLRDLPGHPNIVQPEMLQEASTVRRDEALLECSGVFILSPWVEGTRLDRLLEGERIPRARAVELALAVSEALAHLQAESSVVHRDVKPQNVIVDRKGVPRLVDFNIGRTIEASSGTQVGTPGYKPPDLHDVGWGTDSDPFALCVTLAEMVAGRLLHGNVREWLAEDARLLAPLRDLLDKGTAAARRDRFASAGELRDALAATLVRLRTPPVFNAHAPFPHASEVELQREDWNPYQHRLLTLFSQSRHSNKGTRGLDDFDRWAYVPTRVDRELYGDIAAGRFGLVVITGNAGDGKTAFVQMLQQRLEADHAGEIEVESSANGAVITYHGTRLVTNLDGSQDEGDQTNDDVLATFFAPFSGTSPVQRDDETRVIAINEGRLIDFVTEQRTVFPALEAAVMGFVGEKDYELPEWLLLVNLNLRALTIGAARTESGEVEGDSLSHEILKRFVDARVWEPCTGCAAFDHCYARANAATLRDPAVGPRVAERIRQTFDLVRLRRRLHVTMRDLRSALAYVVAGNRSCDEIVELAAHVDDVDSARSLLAGHLYNSLFAASDRFHPLYRDESAARDRLLRSVAAVDVGKTAHPEDDGRLWLANEAPFGPDPVGLVRTDRQLIERLRSTLPVDPLELASGAARVQVAFVQATLRRKLFLEREDLDWITMFPYAKLPSFQAQLAEVGHDEKMALIRAISNSEGLFSDKFADQLAVRLVTDLTGADRSFVTHHESEFELAPLDRAKAATYVEYEPDSLRLSHTSYENIVLDIDLDLFETLMRILDGYTPSREELRGTWLNLRIFKERLASLPADALLLTHDDRKFHRVARVDPNSIMVSEVG